MGLEVIKEVYRRKSMEREKLRQGLVNDVSQALVRLSKKVSFEEAYIFGSLAEPNQFSEFSDIDIAFKGLDKNKLFSTISLLNRWLGRDVCVVLIEEVHFRDKILREGIKWKKY